MSNAGLGKGTRFLLAGACAVVVIAGMRAASGLIVPVLAAAFLAVISLPPLAWLRRAGVPRWAAVMALLALVIAVLTIATLIVTRNVAMLADNLPGYQLILDERLERIDAWLKERNITADLSSLVDEARPGNLIGYATSGLSALAGLAKDGLFVLLTFAFLAAEAAVIPGKIRQITGRADDDLDRFEAILADVQGYLAVKLQTNLLTGVLVTISCWMLATPYALLLGLLAFLMNFIPTFGAIIAAVPAVLLCLAMNDWSWALGMVAAQVVINVVIGNVVEPRLFGRRLGLSAAVVFLSLVFWGWVLGPIGMLLSVPLTMVVKILLDNSEDLRWMAVLLGPGTTGATPTRASADAVR